MNPKKQLTGERMTDDHAHKTSNGTSVGIREYFTLWLNNIELLIDEKCKRIDERFVNVEDARNLALTAMDARLASMNDGQTKFFTKVEHEAYMKSTEIELRALQDFKLSLETKANQSTVNIALVVSGIGILLSVISLVKEFIK
jgi:C-terminal processing protease CtpA/Prc